MLKKYITENSNAELAYGRLSVGKNHLFEEAGLFWYERTNKENLTKIQPESLIALKRGIFRIYNGLKKLDKKRVRLSW